MIELLSMLEKEDDINVKEEFIYPYSLEQFNEEYLRSIFN
jgi:hypothetical protein